jgi:hypothetical protein
MLAFTHICVLKFCVYCAVSQQAEMLHSRGLRARNRWLLAYTLLKNPRLCALRIRIHRMEAHTDHHSHFVFLPFHNSHFVFLPFHNSHCDEHNNASAEAKAHAGVPSGV